MTIHSIETFIREPVGIVRVRSTDGAEGLGQMAPYSVAITAAVLHRHIAPHALGRDADPEGLVDACLDGEGKFVGSYLARALAGVDTALWDLRGKLEGKGVCELAGGDRRSVRVYASRLGRRVRPEKIAETVVQERNAHGYSAFKVKIGSAQWGAADELPRRTSAFIDALRDALGDEVELLADANGGYTPESAIEAGRLLERRGFTQFEEPCPRQELEWNARVADALEIDVAGGEQEHELAQFRRMLALRAVDVLQPDVCYAGGFTQALRAASLAAAAGIPCQPHSANRSLVMVFGLHLIAAATRPARYTECPVITMPGIRGLFHPPIEVRDGHVRVPEGPGWGVEVDGAWLASAERQLSGARGGSTRLARAGARGRGTLSRGGRRRGRP